MTKTFDAHLYIIDAGWDFADVEYADRHGIGDEDARRIQALAPAHLSAEEREDWAIDAMEALETYCRTARELGHQGAAYDGALAAEALSRRKLIASRFFRRLAAHK